MVRMDSRHVKELFEFYDKMPSPRDKAYCVVQIWKEFEKFYGAQIDDLEKQLSYYKGEAVLAELTLLRTDIRKLLKENGK
jgi:uncharacterized protein YycO